MYYIKFPDKNYLLKHKLSSGINVKFHEDSVQIECLSTNLNFMLVDTVRCTETVVTFDELLTLWKKLFIVNIDIVGVNFDYFTITISKMDSYSSTIDVIFRLRMRNTDPEFLKSIRGYSYSIDTISNTVKLVYNGNLIFKWSLFHSSQYQLVALSSDGNKAVLLSLKHVGTNATLTLVLYNKGVLAETKTVGTKGCVDLNNYLDDLIREPVNKLINCKY